MAADAAFPRRCFAVGPKPFPSCAPCRPGLGLNFDRQERFGPWPKGAGKGRPTLRINHEGAPDA